MAAREALFRASATWVGSRMPPLSRFMAFGVELHASLIGDELYSALTVCSRVYRVSTGCELDKDRQEIPEF